MDRRSWLWRRKSSEKSPGETESSGSMSSHSERFSDDQDVLRASSNSASPSNARSPEVSLKASDEVPETVKSLNEKLSSALSNLKAKEELVKQHSKVAEEAVSGWEKAENEVAGLKKQLESSCQKNTSLEERVSHLDGALKECVRQLRQSREEQDQKVHDAIAKKSQEWDSDRFELNTRIVELKAQLEATKALIDHELRSKFELLKKENSKLKVELLTQSEELQRRTIERDLSIKAAESASKQHLDSIKRVTKLEADCRRLRAAAHKTSNSSSNKLSSSLGYAESIADSYPDSGDRVLSHELSRSGSWASVLLAELDQFRNDKSGANLAKGSVEIDLMDDFLEMEKLAALQETNNRSSSFGNETLCSTRAETEAVKEWMAELEKRLENMTEEKSGLELDLLNAQNDLTALRDQLRAAENDITDLQRQLDLANRLKHASKMEVVSSGAKPKLLESQLESSRLEAGELRENVSMLEAKLGDDRASPIKSSTCSQDLESIENSKTMETQLTGARQEIEKLTEKVALLEWKLEEATVLSADYETKCQDLEMTENRRKELETELGKAQLEFKELQHKVLKFENERQQERVLSTELAHNGAASEAQKKVLESELKSAYTESQQLQEKISLLEQKVETEYARSAELEAAVGALQTEKKILELQLKSAISDVEKISKKVALLECKVEEERALSAELMIQVQAAEANNKVLETQLKLAHNLHEKISLLEEKIQEERKISTEAANNLAVFQEKNKLLESDIQGSHLEAENLQEMLMLLKRELEETRTLAAEAVKHAEILESMKKELESQLEKANSEVNELRESLASLERKADGATDTAGLAMFASNFQDLDTGFSKTTRSIHSKHYTNSNGDLKLKQEKELAAAAENFAECQKTIASLSQKLKSLTAIDVIISEAYNPELSDSSLSLALL